MQVCVGMQPRQGTLQPSLMARPPTAERPPRPTLPPPSSHAVVVEADFPPAFRANMYCRGMNADAGSEQALADFKRFPTWHVAAAAGAVPRWACCT